MRLLSMGLSRRAGAIENRVRIHVPGTAGPDTQKETAGPEPGNSHAWGWPIGISPPPLFHVE